MNKKTLVIQAASYEDGTVDNTNIENQGTISKKHIEKVEDDWDY